MWFVIARLLVSVMTQVTVSPVCAVPDSAMYSRATYTLSSRFVESACARRVSSAAAPLSVDTP